VLRLFFPYRAGQRGRLIQAWSSACARRAGHGLQRRRNPRLNPIYIDDLLAAFSGRWRGRGQTINVAGREVLAVRGWPGASALVGREPVSADRRPAST
jgi:hypothetical protein